MVFLPVLLTPIGDHSGPPGQLWISIPRATQQVEDGGLWDSCTCRDKAAP